MATDHDAPRRFLADRDEESLEELKTQHARTRTPEGSLDETEAVEGFELPGGALFDEELTVAVVPMLGDEFRCSRCFLVQHRSQITDTRRGEPVCRECSQ